MPFHAVLEHRPGTDMLAPHQISSLIANIYNAALDATHWANVLAASAHYIGGAAAGIWMRDPNFASSHHYHFGGDEKLREPVFAHYQSSVQQIAHHAALAGGETGGEGGPATSEYLEARLGQRHKCSSRLVVYRDPRGEPWDEAALKRMQRIAGHMRRAVSLSKWIAADSASAAAMADTLDALSAGVFLIDSSGVTVHANSYGETMLSEGRLLRSVKGKLIVGGFDPTLAIGEIVTIGAAGSARFYFAEAVARGFAGGETYVAHTFPVAADMVCKSGRRPAVAGMIVRRVQLDTCDVVARVARHYGLARRECEVLEAVVEGCGFSEIAEKLAIAPSTVKTYLRRLFAKTGATRQIDLVKLCAAFRSPFAG
jgi:DNA-binding CsgD family transcriptional regulator